LAIAEADENTGVDIKGQYLTIHLKVNAHVMPTQINIRQVLLAFEERGNEAVPK